jgi:hypothetical protein
MKKVRTAFFEPRLRSPIQTSLRSVIRTRDEKNLLITLGLRSWNRDSPALKKIFAALFFKKATACFALSALISV